MSPEKQMSRETSREPTMTDGLVQHAATQVEGTPEVDDDQVDGNCSFRSRLTSDMRAC